MTPEELKAHAERLLQELVRDVEYSNVYDDWDLQDAAEEDWLAIHDLMATASARFTWPD
ncbi:hypothetical protein [Arthrobacter sp. 31Y]|uniref:hypothetical protein n=1 Tax=Arthrobacter sp. 31Y TaxID=1115632 RepID=UPI0004B7D8B8|nr:hypothetical protein [Arthrobacter sp. 31Y]